MNSSTEAGANPNKHDLAESLHALFLESMETRYSDILRFLALIIPALTGFLFIVSQYESAQAWDKPISTFFFATVAVIASQLWGAAYALAMSYRYRYLQASVYRIEEARGIDLLIPHSFKPKPVKGACARLGLSIAPGILQIHVFFFLASIIGTTLAFCFLADWTWRSIATLCFGVFCAATVYLLGAWHYPRKLAAILESLEQRKREEQIRQRIKQ